MRKGFGSSEKLTMVTEDKSVKETLNKKTLLRREKNKRRESEKKEERKARLVGLSWDEGNEFMCKAADVVPLMAPTVSTFVTPREVFDLQGELCVLQAWEKADIVNQESVPVGKRCYAPGARMYLQWALVSKLREVGCVDFGSFDPGKLPWFPDALALPNSFWWMIKHSLPYTEDGATGETRYSFSALPSSSHNVVDPWSSPSADYSDTLINGQGIGNGHYHSGEIRLHDDYVGTSVPFADIVKLAPEYSSLFKRSGLKCMTYGDLGKTAPDGSAYCSIDSAHGSPIFSIFQKYNPDLGYLFASYGGRVKQSEDTQNYVKIRNHNDVAVSPSGRVYGTLLWSHMCFAHLVNCREYRCDEKKLKYYLGPKKLKTFVGVQRTFNFASWHEKINECVEIMGGQDENAEAKVDASFYFQFATLADMAIVKRLRESSPNFVYGCVPKVEEEYSTWLNTGGIGEEIRSVKFPAVMSDYLDCLGGNVVNGIPLFWSYGTIYGDSNNPYRQLHITGFVSTDGNANKAGSFNVKIGVAINPSINGLVWNGAQWNLYDNHDAWGYIVEWPVLGLSSMVSNVNIVVMSQIGGSGRFIGYSGKGRLGAANSFAVLCGSSQIYPANDEPQIIENLWEAYYRECTMVRSCVPILGSDLARSWCQSMRFAELVSDEEVNVGGSKYMQGSGDLSYHDSVSQRVFSETLGLGSSFDQVMSYAVPRGGTQVDMGFFKYSKDKATTSFVPILNSMFSWIATDKMDGNNVGDDIVLGHKKFNLNTAYGRQILRDQIAKAIGAVALA